MVMHRLDQTEVTSSVGAVETKVDTLDTNVDTLVALSDCKQFRQYVAPHPAATNVLDGDPTNDKIATDTATTQSTSYVILHEVSIDPGVFDVAQAFFDLSIEAAAPDGGGGGGGNAKWMVCADGDELGNGSAPDGNYADLSGEFTVAVSAGDHTVSGPATHANMAATPFNLALVGKVGSASDTLTVTMYANDCTVDLDLTRN